MPFGSPECSSPMLIELENTRAYRPIFDYLTDALDTQQLTVDTYIDWVYGLFATALLNLLEPSPQGNEHSPQSANHMPSHVSMLSGKASQQVSLCYLTLKLPVMLYSQLFTTSKCSGTSICLPSG